MAVVRRGAYISGVIDDLYSQKILTLAANMPGAGRLERPGGAAERVSKLCGSRVRVEVSVADGVIRDFAQEVRACALGQASAAVLGANVLGARIEEVELARDALSAMLKTGGPPPEGRFADLAVLHVVRDYPARHASTLLAFEACAAAAREAERTPAAAPG